MSTTAWTLEEYRRAPCRCASLPYWKCRGMTMPEGIRVVHETEFRPEEFPGWGDTRYFRLHHSLQNIGAAELPGIGLRTAGEKDIGQMAAVINASYANLTVREEQLREYVCRAVYDPALWVVAEEKNGKIAGCGIAELDREVPEGMLEWIQVLPEYRRRGVGRLIVNGLLHRMAGMAQFATVSGQADDPLHPELLYRACGFKGEDVWHVLRAP